MIIQVYFGDIGTDSSVIREYFASHGAVCPDNANPAEYMLEAIGAGLTPQVGYQDWAELWCESPEFQDTLDEIERIKTEPIKGDQDYFLEIHHSVLVPAEGRDEEGFRWVVGVPELCVYEGLHSRRDLVDSVPFVPATGSQYEGSAVQALLYVSGQVNPSDPPVSNTDLSSLPDRCWVCFVPAIIQVQLVPLWIFNRREHPIFDFSTALHTVLNSNRSNQVHSSGNPTVGSTLPRCLPSLSSCRKSPTRSSARLCTGL